MASLKNMRYVKHAYPNSSHLRQHLAHLIVDHEVCHMVIGGRVTVDQDHVIAAETPHLGRRGIDRQRGTRHDQRIRVTDIFDCLHYRVLGQGFFI